MTLMKVALDFLVNRLYYQIPSQDLRIDYTRLPALPRDQFIIERVHLKAQGKLPPSDNAIALQFPLRLQDFSNRKCDGWQATARKPTDIG